MQILLTHSWFFFNSQVYLWHYSHGETFIVLQRNTICSEIGRSKGGELWLSIISSSLSLLQWGVFHCNYSFVTFNILQMPWFLFVCYENTLQRWVVHVPKTYVGIQRPSWPVPVTNRTTKYCHGSLVKGVARIPRNQNTIAENTAFLRPNLRIDK